MDEHIFLYYQAIDTDITAPCFESPILLCGVNATSDIYACAYLRAFSRRREGRRPIKSF
jgi:hypothetical protein